jgi:hypothetical protein
MSKTVNIILIAFIVILFNISYHQYEYLNTTSGVKDKLENKYQEREKQTNMVLMKKKRNISNKKLRILDNRPVPKDVLKRNQYLGKVVGQNDVKPKVVKDDEFIDYEDHDPSWKDIFTITANKLGIN